MALHLPRHHVIPEHDVILQEPLDVLHRGRIFLPVLFPFLCAFRLLVVFDSSLFILHSSILSRRKDGANRVQSSLLELPRCSPFSHCGYHNAKVRKEGARDKNCPSFGMFFGIFGIIFGTGQG